MTVPLKTVLIFLLLQYSTYLKGPRDKHIKTMVLRQILYITGYV